MRKSSLREFHFRTAHLHNLIVLCALARFYQVARHVRQKHQLILKLLLCCSHLGEYGSRAGFELSDSGFCLFGFRLETLLHEGSDFCRFFLLLREQSIALRLEGATLCVQFEDLVHDRLGVKVLDLKLGDDQVAVLAQCL